MGLLTWASICEALVGVKPGDHGSRRFFLPEPKRNNHSDSICSIFPLEF